MNEAKKFAYAIECFIAAMIMSARAFAGGILPEGYTEIEYIQGNGSDACIFTDYTPQPNTDKIEAVIEWPEGMLDINQTIWCSRGETSIKDTWTLFFLNTDKCFRFDYGPQGSVAQEKSNFKPSAGKKYTITAEDNTITYSANGSVLETKSMQQSFAYTSGGVLALFASHLNGSTVDNYGKHKLYSFKVWRERKLIHYFVPCKDSSGVATMVDICDNAATLTKRGTFTAGQQGHYYDDSFFLSGDVLLVSGAPDFCGSPSPAYGSHTGLSGGDTLDVSCASYTNTEQLVEYICKGWKLFDADGNEVSSGTELSFTYTHPTPAAPRQLVWQWSVRPMSTVAPSAILPVGGAAFHVDASMPSTLTTVESGGKRLVTAWRDASGGTMQALAGAGSRPCLVTDDGFPYVDFGPRIAGDAPSTNDNAGALAWSSELVTIREVFLVFSDYPDLSQSFFLSAASSYDFHRGANKTLFEGGWSNANVRGGLIEVDGVERPINYALPGGFHIIHLRTKGNVTAGRFAWDRNINYGGQRLQEVVVYTKELTNDEAQKVFNYLNDKWISNVLTIDGSPSRIGSPTPAYGFHKGLSAGDTLDMSCASFTNAEQMIEYLCIGWKLLDADGIEVSNGTGTSFTYTHPTPTKETPVTRRHLEWQWSERSMSTVAPDATLPVGGAAFHVDASMPTTLTTVESGGKQLVTVWRDASGGSMKAIKEEGSRPCLVTDDVLPYVDFGPRISLNGGTPPLTDDNAGALVWSQSLTAIREVFLVFSDYPGVKSSFFITAAGPSNYQFHRGPNGQLFNNTYASGYIKNGLIEVDGVERPINYALPEGFHIIHLRTTGNLPGGRFAWDRTEAYGGQRLQEVVIYTKTLTDDESQKVFNYLNDKWIVISDVLKIDAAPSRIGSPTPIYGYVSNLSAGDTRVVSCGKVLSKDADGVMYLCMGWKLYNHAGEVVGRGSGTSFTYTHLTPAEYRRLEWQWKKRDNMGFFISVR